MSFLDFIGKLSTTLSFSITFGTVILYGALGEVLTEKGGKPSPARMRSSAFWSRCSAALPPRLWPDCSTPS